MGAENDTLDSWGLKETLELSDTGRMPHFAQGLCFNLTNPLPGNLELPAHFLQRAAISIDQPKSLLEHLALAIGEGLKYVLDFFLQQNNGSHVTRVFGSPVLNKVAEISFFALAHWRLKRNWLLRHL